MKTSPLNISRGLAALSLLAMSAAPVNAASIVFDFSRTSGDRAHYFGTNQTANSMSDANNTTTGFYVTSANFSFKFPTINNSGWSIINDSQPNVENATLPAGSENFLVSADSPLTIRTRLITLSSGDSGVKSYGALLFGLSDFSATASGYMAMYTRAPGSSSSIGVYHFTNGIIGSQIASTNLGSSGDQPFFMDLAVDGSGAFVFNLFLDTSIAGTGNAIARLTSGDFDTATAYASVSGTIAGYGSGYAGVYFRNDSLTKTGSADFGNFYMDYTAVPEPGGLSLFGIAGLLMWGVRRPRRRTC